ncbi:MAG: hypothetical protein WBZ40_06710 [Acidimicrobiia bacterium]
MFRFIFRLFKFALLALFGVAVAAKFLLESHASSETEEIDLVNIFGGEKLSSTAAPFYGGKITSMFAGTMLDLRRATPAPTGIYLDVLAACSGVDLIVPDGWRVVFDGNVYGGGFTDATNETTDPDAPILRIGGMVLMSGLRVSTRATLEVVV